ncbi:phosphoserine aminotransferase-like protein [Coniochaeta ligniaria NRRL 30616]|uniref:phosphoserine transaminase n=1 Tax=Coniochaeta ligniaria NRRL 30616 TaxID=1408157 RepID=A0A1J7JPE5_9PEZI|nr:phosphoserine aminotransferase-like protein [Coniochaeta ligniaria NRRL 30616]
MPERSEITYFGAGPAGLPTDVLETASEALINYKNTGLGLAEHSHRSELATNIINEAKADLASYLDIDESKYEILFMQAGGTGEFSAVVYNLVGAWVARKIAGLGDLKGEDLYAALREHIDGPKGKLVLDYIVTGSWSLKAYQEAVRLVGPEHVNLVVDAREHNNGKFGVIPDQKHWKLSDDAALVYYCANETVDGVEFPEFPTVLRKSHEKDGVHFPIVVADMSSNILSRREPVDEHSIIFFGAQKNLGTPGVAVAIVKKAFLPPTCSQPAPTIMRKVGLPVPPIMFQYQEMAKNNSLYNTLSVFDVFVAGQVLKKLLKTYPNKVDGQQAVAEKKAQLIYGALEAHPEVYKIVPDKTARSRMNICFRVTKNGDVDASEKAFLAAATKQGLTGLKGHRSVGGIRASNYNSISLEGAEKLAGFIGEFAKA